MAGHGMAQFQKHFNAEIEEVVDSRTITFEQLAENFYLPINEVAKKLGVCLTVLKKVCRKQGIPRWPYRKLKSLDKSIESLRNSALNCPAEAPSIFEEIENLEKQKIEICQNPSILVKEGAPPTPDPLSPDPARLHPQSQQPQHQVRFSGVPACRSEPLQKKKRERRKVKKTPHHPTPHPFNNIPTSPSTSSSSLFSTNPQPQQPRHSTTTDSHLFPTAFQQFEPTGGGDVFGGGSTSPSMDPFDPSPISPESPGSPPRSLSSSSSRQWGNFPQSKSPTIPHHRNNNNNNKNNNNNNNNFPSANTTPIGSPLLQPSTQSSTRTRKRDALDSPFSPFSSYASPQLFGVTQPTNFNLTPAHQQPQQQQPPPPQTFSSPQLPQLEQKLRETCLSPSTSAYTPQPLLPTTTTTTPTTTTTNPTNPTTMGGHFSLAPGGGSGLNSAFLPSFQELVSFQALPSQNYYRNQLGSMTPDIPRPSKRMRENRDRSPGEMGDLTLPSLDNTLPSLDSFAPPH